MKEELRNKLQWIADEIVEILAEKDDAYGSSWKSRGGFSAFFQLDRKFSRIEQMAEASKYDIFMAMLDYTDGPDTMKDLIGYALLTLSETYDPAQGVVAEVPTTPYMFEGKSLVSRRHPEPDEIDSPPLSEDSMEQIEIDLKPPRLGCGGPTSAGRPCGSVILCHECFIGQEASREYVDQDREK